MPRKKTPTAPSTAGSVYLDDDEQLVEEVTTTKRIGRQKRKSDDDESDDTPPVEIDGELIDGDDDDEPTFSDTSLAAIIYGEGSDQITNQFCTVYVRRNPDSMNDKFLTPCSDVTNLPRITSVPLSTDTADIEDRVRSEYGGGHYFFQIFYEGRLGKCWRSTLADLPQAVAAARLAAQPAAAEPQPTAAPVNPIDTFLEVGKKMREFKEELFGEREREFEKQIADLKEEVAAAKANQLPAAPQSETLVILEKALAAGNPDLTDRLLDYAFPASENGSRHWLAELVDVGLKNKDTILSLAGSLLGTPQPATQPSVADIMRGPAPAALAEPPPAASRFQRRTPEPPPAEADPITTMKNENETEKKTAAEALKELTNGLNYRSESDSGWTVWQPSNSKSTDRLACGLMKRLTGCSTCEARDFGKWFEHTIATQDDRERYEILRDAMLQMLTGLKVFRMFAASPYNLAVYVVGFDVDNNLVGIMAGATET